MPMFPEAPLRLSMMMRVPSWAPIGSAIRRAVMSTLPPGGKGAIKRIGWFGYPCAQTSGDAANRTAVQMQRNPMERTLGGTAGIVTSSLGIITASTRRILQVRARSVAYAKPRAPAEAFELARRPGAKVLAGGQSLMPALNMRLSQPELLVDISGLPFKEISLEQGVLRIGALVTHSQIEKSGEIAKHAPLLAQAVKHVAHPAISNRGPLGCTSALADPAAEYPACMVALDASIVVAGAGGERLVRAQEFFKGLFEVDLAPGELVAAVEVPAQLKDQRSVFLELARRHGD